MLEEIFKLKNIKLTKQRKKIYQTVELLKEAELKDIQKECHGEMDNSTIYRIVELFVEKGIFIKNLDNDLNICYIINSNEHKHYINCIKCHQKTEIDFCPADKVNDLGYELISHQIQINGICHNCQKK